VERLVLIDALGLWRDDAQPADVLILPADELARYFLSAVRHERPDAPPPVYIVSLFDEYAQNFERHLVETLPAAARMELHLFRGASGRHEDAKQHFSLLAITLRQRRVGWRRVVEIRGAPWRIAGALDDRLERAITALPFKQKRARLGHGVHPSFRGAECLPACK
jgi:hypothetical protein